MANVTGVGSSGLSEDVIIHIATTFDDKGLKQSNKRIQELGRGLERAQQEAKRFKAEYLSVLFFSLAIQRVTKSIIDAGVNTFRSITESTYGISTSLLAIAAGFEFLKFTIGDAINTAIEPLIPAILGIIDALGDFIQQNPELVAGLVITASALATLGFVLATVKLGLDGLIIAIGGRGLAGALGTGGIVGFASSLLTLGVVLQILIGGWDNFAKAGGSALALISNILAGDYANALKNASLFTDNFFTGLTAGFIELAKTISAVVGFGLTLILQISAALGAFVSSLGQMLAGKNFDYYSTCKLR